MIVDFIIRILSKDVITQILSREFIIFVILVCLLLFNWMYFAFNYKLLLCFCLLVLLFYSNSKDLIKYWYNYNIILNANSFYKNIVRRPLNINNDISLVLYKIRVFYPYDKTNYRYLIHNCNKLSYYIDNKSEFCYSIYKEKIDKYCNRILNAYNAIGHSLPKKIDNYNNILIELQNLLYSYTNSVKKEDVEKYDKMSYVNNQFNKYLL